MDLKKELGGVADAVLKIMDEALKGDQHKIDANKNNKIDAHDFKLLRSKKKVEEAAAKPDFIDLDKDGDKKEPMKKAASDKKMKEEVKQIDELSNKTLYSYLRKTGGVKSSTEVHPRNTSNVPHDLQYQAQDSAKSRINARKGHGSVAPKGYAKEEVELTQEEFDQLDELSKDTLKSYYKGSVESGMKAQNRAVNTSMGGSDSEHKKNITDINKRVSGQDAVTKRLGSKETMSMDKESGVSRLAKYKPTKPNPKKYS